MRTFALAVAVFWGSAAGIMAQQPMNQQPATPPAADQYTAHLDHVLGQWEKAMTGLQSLSAVCKRTTIDKTYQTTEVFEGQAKFLKATGANQSSRASLEMYKQGKRDVFEKYVCTGTYLYEYAPANKVIRVHQLPAPKNGQFSDDNFLSFLFGMKAAEAKKRYALEYVPPRPGDKWYYYIRIQPRAAADRADFTEARLVLLQSNFMPRQLWFQQPNGNEITWDFPKLETNGNVRATEFVQPALPAGWQFMHAPAQTQARVIRQNQ